MDTKKDLDKLLKEIDNKRAMGEASTEELETECLKLVEEHDSLEDKGKIYAQIAFIYSQSGMKQPDKVITYCREALKYPLEVEMVCQIYIFWADALQVTHRDSIGSKFAAARQEIIKPCLNGLKVVLNNLTATSTQPLPPISKYDYGGPTTQPAYREMVDKHSEETAARTQALFQNKLLEWRDTLTSKCISLYSQEPYATDELKQQADEVLNNNEIVEWMVTEVERRIG